jgi:hypothetical protein
MNQEFLNQLGVSYSIWVIEQSEDKKRFNRGALLNVGFMLAGNYYASHHESHESSNSDSDSTYIFHDVDLLPHKALLPWYRLFPITPIQIGSAWERYKGLGQNYMGGITSVSQDWFIRLNGYPNNFWGWGGEDDELKRRTTNIITHAGDHDDSSCIVVHHVTSETLCKQHCSKHLPSECKETWIADLEQLNSVEQKLNVVRAMNAIFPSEEKRKRKYEHVFTWRKNGLSNITQCVASVKHVIQDRRPCLFFRVTFC